MLVASFFPLDDVACLTSPRWCARRPRRRAIGPADEQMQTQLQTRCSKRQIGSSKCDLFPQGFAAHLRAGSGQKKDRMGRPGLFSPGFVQRACPAAMRLVSTLSSLMLLKCPGWAGHTWAVGVQGKKRWSRRARRSRATPGNCSLTTHPFAPFAPFEEGGVVLSLAGQYALPSFGLASSGDPAACDHPMAARASQRLLLRLCLCSCRPGTKYAHTLRAHVELRWSRIASAQGRCDRATALQQDSPGASFVHGALFASHSRSHIYDCLSSHRDVPQPLLSSVPIPPPLVPCPYALARSLCGSRPLILRNLISAEVESGLGNSLPVPRQH